MTATGPLQTIVDSLAADIRRDVAIDDRQIRWIVHSPHFDEPDAARMESILAHRSSDDAAQWAFSFGIEHAEGPVRLPANERIGAQPRLCIPLRSHGVSRSSIPTGSRGPRSRLKSDTATAKRSRRLRAPVSPSE